MKKTKVIISIILTAVMLSAMILPVTADDFQAEVGKLAVKNTTPTIDGNINAAEYGSAGVLDATSMVTSYSPRSKVLISANISFAWDDSALYFAADITDPSYIESTVMEDVNSGDVEENAIPFDGDTMSLCLDPLGALYEAGFSDNKDQGAYYNVAIVGGTPKLYRSVYSPVDITTQSGVQIAGSTTDDGWRFEVALPWNLLLEDALGEAEGEISPDEMTKALVTSLGATSRATVIYTDRALKEGDFAQYASDDVADGQLFTLSMEISVATVSRDGTPAGKLDNSYCFKTFGIMLAMGDASGDMPAETEAPVTTVVPETKEETQDPSQTTEFDPMAIVNSNRGDDGGSGNGENKGGGNVGLIIGIVIAVIAVAAVVLFFVIKKKNGGATPPSAQTTVPTPSTDDIKTPSAEAAEAENKAKAEEKEKTSEEEYEEEEYIEEEYVDEDEE